MLTQATLCARALLLAVRGRFITPEMVRNDYNRLSPTYDEYFSTHVVKHSNEMLARVGVESGVHAVDLACGTGAVALAVAQQAGPSGHVVGIDASPGMIEQARAKASRLDDAAPVEFRRGHMEDELASLPDTSLDLVTCAWAIGYTNPARLVRTAAAKLRPGGKLGIIENRRNTLEPIRRTCFNVAASMPGHVRHIMDLHVRLPRDARCLKGYVDGAGLDVLQTWEGEEVFRFESGADVLNWVLHTGASAGFDKVMDEHVRELCDQRFIEYIERDYLRNGAIEVAHQYAAVIAHKA